MLGGRNLVVDTFSEVYTLLQPWTTYEFWDMATHDPIPNSVYVIGRKQFVENADKIKEMIQRPDLLIFFDNAAEGSWTLVSQLQMLKLDELARQHRLYVIGGGDMEDAYKYIRHDHFLSVILNYDENNAAAKRTPEIFSKTDKPYKFFFLNGRARPHRKYLYERFRESNLLDQAIWTMLDSRPSLSRMFNLNRNGTDLMATISQLRWLDPKYEFQFYRNATITPGPAQRTFVKNDLFSNQWGEIYLEPAPYIDTYFSLVTETVYEYPYSFRTEKTAKVLAMGHPFIIAGSIGFYRDLRNVGFRTFHGIIDESFDMIENHQDRMDRIHDIVQDLCNQDLTSFLAACHDVCKYNQQHLQELIPRIRSEFPSQFFNLIANHE
jgi:hypothetical protein